MGKDDKEDSGFGFKDKQKALDTLRLLEDHDANYRRLTVRGLLGRAKRVLSMTKAPDKKKNITEAMEVFENWLSELNDGKEKSDSDKKKKDDKKEQNDEQEQNGEDVEDTKGAKDAPSDTVPGLGFKDKAAAEGTLVELEGRDPDYQKLAVKGLIGRAKRVLTCTKDETKLSNINEAIALFEKFLDDFDTKHMSKENNPYVSLGIVNTCLGVAEEKGMDVDEQQKAFIKAYESVDGDYKKLRTVHEKEGGKTWDIVRNSALKSLKEKHSKSALFTDSEKPTVDHLELLLWAYSPEPAKTKKLIPETKREPETNRKRKSSGGDGDGGKKRKD